jgi:ABC-type nitrate/sulfonate/bicarbonate transport system substrate-binding protein
MRQDRRFKLNILQLTSLWLILSSSVFARTQANEHVVLQLKWTDQFQFAGYYMAKHMGYYEDVGIDIELRPGSPSLDVTEEVISGNADFGVGTSSLLLDYA